MKVIAFNGSARKDGNTAILIKQALRELEREGIETELVQLAGTRIQGCIACSECFETRDQCCVVTDDAVNEYIAKMLHADGIILGSPTYFADITPELKALIDRAGMVARANGDMFQRKVGAAVVNDATRWRYSRIRLDQSLLLHWSNDRSRFELLEYRYRPWYR